MNASKPPGWTNYQNLSRPMPNDEFERYHSKSLHIENIKISFVRQEVLEPPTSGSGGQNYTGAYISVCKP